MERTAGRTARCAYCKKEEPSSERLAFYEYRGPGNGRTCDHCGWALCCHAQNATEFGALPNGEMVEWNTVADKPCHVTDHAWDDSAGREFDGFYCGCRGWD